MSSIGDIGSGIGGAVSTLFGGLGDLSSASAYKKAATIAQQNAALTEKSTRIQEMQAQRSAFLGIGAEKADTAAAGLEINSGAAGSLLRASGQQAGLQQGLIGLQGQTTAAGFEAQAASYQGQAGAASAAGGGGILGGILKGVGAVAGLFGL